MLNLSPIIFGAFSFSEAERNNMKNKKVRYAAVVGIMSAIAVVLQFLEFPIPLVPSFIKFDFSDLPGLITAFALGPVAGVLVSLIKKGLLTLAQAAEEAHMTVAEFEAKTGLKA